MTIAKEESVMFEHGGSATTDEFTAMTDPDNQEAFGLSIERWSPIFTEHPNTSDLDVLGTYDMADFCVHKDMLCCALIDVDGLGTTENLYFRTLASEASGDQSWSSTTSILASNSIDQTVKPTIVSDGHTIAVYLMYGSDLRRYISTNDGSSWTLQGTYTFSNTVYHLAATCPNTVYAVCTTSTSNVNQTTALIYDGTSTLSVFGTVMRPKLPYLPDSFDAVRLVDFGWMLDFDSTGAVNCASPSKLDNLPSGAFSVELVVQTDYTIGGSYWAAIFNKGTALRVTMYTGTGITVTVEHDTDNAVSTTGGDDLVVPDGKKHHILIVFDAAGTDTPLAKTAYIAINGRWVETYTTQDTGSGSYSGDASDNMRLGQTDKGSPPPPNFSYFHGWSRVSDVVRWKPEDGNFVPPDLDACPAEDSDTVWLGISTEGQGSTILDRSDTPSNGTIVATGNWMATNRAKDLLVWSVDLPPYCGDNEEGAVAYKRQGLIGCHVHWSQYGETDPQYDRTPRFSEIFHIDVYDRAGPNQYRSDIRLSKMPNGRIFLTAWGQDGANNVPDSDWLDEPEGIFMYWSNDGRYFTTPSMYATSEFTYYPHAMTSDHAGIEKLLYNPPYVYSVALSEQWRAPATRLFGEPHDDVVLNAPEDHIIQMGLNYGDSSQSSW
jgi:hypothetical protein